MDDKKLKEFLQMDQSAPTKPTGEWNQIAARMEKRPSGFSFRSFPQMTALASVAILFILSSQFFYKATELTESEAEEISTYLFDVEDYFIDSDELYSWVDEA